MQSQLRGLDDKSASKGWRTNKRMNKNAVQTTNLYLRYATGDSFAVQFCCTSLATSLLAMAQLYLPPRSPYHFNEPIATLSFACRRG